MPFSLVTWKRINLGSTLLNCGCVFAFATTIRNSIELLNENLTDHASILHFIWRGGEMMPLIGSVPDTTEGASNVATCCSNSGYSHVTRQRRPASASWDWLWSRLAPSVYIIAQKQLGISSLIYRRPVAALRLLKTKTKLSSRQSELRMQRNYIAFTF